MAVEIEFANVIIRKRAIADKYPGGLDAFAATELPNYTEDTDLVRVGFMSTAEALDLADGLVQHGFAFDETAGSDVAIVEHDFCPDWLATGLIEGTVGCWLADKPPGPIIKCKNGFLLRCPRSLYEQLETVMKARDIDVTRHKPEGDDREDYIAVIRFSRGDSAIEANVLGLGDGDAPVGLWATRDFKRRAQCAADIDLAEEVEAVLAGASETDK